MTLRDKGVGLSLQLLSPVLPQAAVTWPESDRRSEIRLQEVCLETFHRSTLASKSWQSRAKTVLLPDGARNTQHAHGPRHPHDVTAYASSCMFTGLSHELNPELRGILFCLLKLPLGGQSTEFIFYEMLI